MGKMVVRQVAMQRDMKLVAAIDSPSCQDVGKDIGKLAGSGWLGVEVIGAEEIADVLARVKPNVLIDFTTTEAVVQNVKAAAETGVSIVVGTTGLTKQQRKKTGEIVKRENIKAVISPNFSVGVNVFFKSIGEMARLLGKDYEPSVEEVHHSGKRDTPSGTALKVAQIVSEKMNVKKEKIKIRSTREGDVVGDHTVKFSNPYENIKIIHRAKTRETFAAGAIRAAHYVATKGKRGVIKEMQDVLDLK